jgi:tryptophan halogenase
VLNLRGMQRVCILGGGTAGWFAALQMRQIFNPTVEIVVISAPEIPIVGVGEGGVLNLIEMLGRLNIDLQDFVSETGSNMKLGFRYERWRTGQNDDAYYHLFPTGKNGLEWVENGYYPYLSGLLNHGVDVSAHMDSLQLSDRRAPFDEVLQLLLEKKNNFGASLHFDTFRVGKYLRKVALSRNILHVEGMVQDFELDSESNYVKSIKLADTEIPCDFLIDASGFARVVIGKKYKTKWHSFNDMLIMNKALPFHLPHQEGVGVELVTRATAMSAGWVWQIPLQERIGAGYVYNDNFMSDDAALNEVEQWLGKKIQPVRPIKFEAGYYEQVWVNNVLAIGLASGFVEPLEATSIGQMLSQLEIFSTFIVSNHGVISQQNVDYFNEQNAQYWRGLGDFIRMHYDTGRADTPFWKHMLNVPVSESYQELKLCWQHRTPRQIDFSQHDMSGSIMFDVPNWLAVGVGVGIIKPQATVSELMALSPEKKQKLAQYLHETKRKLNQN